MKIKKKVKFMKSGKLLSVITISFVTMSLLLSGCSSTKNQSSSDSSSSTQETSTRTIRFATWDSGDQLKYEQQVAAQFEAENPGVKVQVESYSSDYDTKIGAAFGAKNAADVLYMWNFPNYYNSLEPLDNYIEEDADMMQAVSDDFYPGVLNYCKFDNETYGLPVGFTTRVIYYNKTLFNEAGIEFPQDGWTWDQFKEIAEKLTNAQDKQYGFVLPSSGNTYAFQEYVWSNEGNYISDDGKTLAGFMDSKETKQAVQTIADLATSGCATVADDVQATFQTGKVAMMENGIWPYQTLKNAGMDIGVVEIPAFPGKSVKGVIHTAGVSISKDSQNKDLAWQFVKYFISAESAKVRKGDMPVLKSVVNEQKLMEDSQYKPFYTMLERSTNTPAFATTTSWSQIDSVLDNAISSVIFGKASAEDALDEAVKDAQQYLN